MTCPRSHDLLQRRLDGETIVDAALEAHLRACTECQARFAAARRLEAGLALLAPPCPPADLAARLAGRLGEETRALRRRRLLRRSFAALAAAVLVAVGVWQFFRQAPATTEPTPPNREPVVQQTEPSPVRIREQVAEAGESVVGVFGRAVGQTRKVLPKVSGPELADPMSELDKPAEALREAGHGVTAGLEPVTVSVPRAVRMLLHMTPLTGDDRPRI
jgi:anti-sigma factor RsiW